MGKTCRCSSSAPSLDVQPLKQSCQVALSDLGASGVIAVVDVRGKGDRAHERDHVVGGQIAAHDSGDAGSVEQARADRPQGLLQFGDARQGVRGRGDDRRQRNLRRQSTGPILPTTRPTSLRLAALRRNGHQGSCKPWSRMVQGASRNTVPDRPFNLGSGSAPVLGRRFSQHRSQLLYVGGGGPIEPPRQRISPLAQPAASALVVHEVASERSVFRLGTQGAGSVIGSPSLLPVAVRHRIVARTSRPM